MTKFLFLEVLRDNFSKLCDKSKMTSVIVTFSFKSFYWILSYRLTSALNWELFCLKFIKKKGYSYLSVWQIHVEHAYLVVRKRTKTLEKACESNFFHSFKVIQMELDTHGPIKMCISIFLWGPTYGFKRYAPCSRMCFFMYFHMERLYLKLLPQFSIDLI